jgi:hypothetical protein
MAQQTALEWLINEWPILECNIPPRIIEQAKALEKEQIVKAYYLHSYFDNYTEEDGEQYYNEKYGK